MIQKIYKVKNGFVTFFSICMLSTILFSCTKTMTPDELNFEYKDYLVVDGTITTEKKEHKIVLSHTLSFTGTDTLRMETGASVSVSNEDTTIYLTEKQAGEYVTSPDFFGITDKTYVLHILLTNGEQYSASCYLKPAMIVDTMYAKYESKSYGIYFRAHDLKGGGAACIMNLYMNDSLMTKNVRDKLIYAKGIFYERLFNLDENILKQDTSRIEIQMNSIPYQMFEYTEDIKNETIYSAEFFRTLPANVRTNISEGGIGYFLASDVITTTIQIVKSNK